MSLKAVCRDMMTYPQYLIHILSNTAKDDISYTYDMFPIFFLYTS